ncbi:splicing regulatory glutamine/lysine-rich protein 1 isoform X3 [Brachyhypopomus gauderio]
MRTLFGFLGDIEELRLYPPDNTPLSFSSKVCYVKYREPSSVGVAQHLTNTVFIDRALIVVPCAEGKIPEEAKALSLLAPATPVASLMPGGGLLPIPSTAQLQNLALPLATRGPQPPGRDTSVAALSATPPQPPIMGNVDPSKIDEIRRTVYVGNLNSQTTTAEQLMEFFKQVGEVKFVRMAGDETQPTRFAFVEFANQESVARALAFNGVMFGDRALKINHSNNAIVKPPELTPQAAAKELEDVMKRVREAQSTIAAAIKPGPPAELPHSCLLAGESKKRSSSKSRRARKSRSSSHSRSHSRRKRSHSRHRDRPLGKSRQQTSNSCGLHKKGSCSREKKHSRTRSHSRDRRKEKDGKTRKRDEDDRRREKKGRTPPKGHSRSARSRSTSRGHRKRSRSQSRSPRRKARLASPKRGRKERRRAYGRDSSRERNESSASRRWSNRDLEQQQRSAKTTQMGAAYKQEELGYDSNGEASSCSISEDLSPHAHLNGSYSSTHGEDEELSATE